MNRLRVIVLFYSLLFFACIGEDNVENTEPDMNAMPTLDGSSTAEVDTDAPPMIDMAGMIDMELRGDPEEQRLSSSVCGLNDRGFY